MKIYNKKRFTSGIISLIICVVGLFIDSLNGLSITTSILILILFISSITGIRRSFSKSASREDIITAADEREQYVTLKTSHKVLQIISVTNYIISIVSMVMYAVTKDQGWLGWFILSAIYCVVLFVTEIFINIYYNKHK